MKKICVEEILRRRKPSREIEMEKFAVWLVKESVGKKMIS